MICEYIGILYLLPIIMQPRGKKNKSAQEGIKNSRLKLEDSVRFLIESITEDPLREGLLDTPRRVVDAFTRMFAGYGQDPKKIATTFNAENYDEMIVVRDIEFYSMCEHHLLSFFGKAHIGYIPDKKIIGLSKIPRVVDIFARRLQNQERLTMNIAETLKELITPRGVGVVIEAEHLCVKSRGIEKQHAKVVTSAMLGLFKKDLNTRSEFLKLINHV